MKTIHSGGEGVYALYLPDGTYRVGFATWQAFYPPLYWPGAPTLEEALDVVVAGAEVPTFGAIRSEDPQAGPAIRGTITVEGAGVPTEPLRVTAWRWNEVTSSWADVPEAFSAPFDGTYALYVPAGTYRVGFAHYASRYDPVFFAAAGAVRTIDEADDVVVTVDDVVNIDVTVLENRGVSGTITTDTPEGLPPGPVGGPTVRAWR